MISAKRRKTSDGRHSIFRDEAVQYYLEVREQDVLPQFVPPRRFVLLWALFGLLVVTAGSAAYSVRIPEYASGQAVVVGENTEAPNGGAVVTAFLPPEDLRGLKKGQKLLLQPGPGGQLLTRSVVSVEPEVLSPEAARERFNLGGAAAAAVERPSAVATAPLGPLPAGAAASKDADSVYHADVEVGSRRVVSMLFGGKVPAGGDR